MTKAARAQLALAILRAYRKDGDFSGLSNSELLDILDQLEAHSRQCLVETARGMLQSLTKLGFAHKEIAASTEADESVVSRVHNGDPDVQVGLLRLRDFTGALARYLPAARRSRVLEAVNLDTVVVTILDLSASDVDTDKTSPAIKSAVLTNLTNYLCGPVESQDRVCLPQGVSGAMVRVGPPDSDVWVFQFDGGDDEARLRATLHELEHLRDRLASRIKTAQAERKHSKARSSYWTGRS